MRRGRFWLGVAISLLCLFLAIKDINLADLLTALRGANYGLVLGTALLTALGMWARAVRWQLLFYPLTGLPLGKLLSVLNIGYLLNNILPARLGDLARAYLIGQLTGVSKARALSTVLVERVVDVLVVAFLLAALLPFIPVPEWAARPGLLLGLAVLALAGLLVALARGRQRATSLVERLLRLSPWLERRGARQLVNALLDGLEILRFPGPAALLGVGSILIWSVGIAQFHTALVAFDLQLPITATIFVLSVTALGMTVPSSPGYIGVWEYTIVLALSPFQVEKSLALSYALVLHATVYLTLTAMGLVSLWQEGLALGTISQEVMPTDEQAGGTAAGRNEG